jgi:predicted TIM-barrel fold metal-dependent hydrolase
VIDGITVIDAHVHAARWTTLPPAWREWARGFGKRVPLDDLYDDTGTLDPLRFDAYMESEGVDHALLFCEYSPRVTGTQPFEDLLPIVEQNPNRFRPVANLNPHLHYPADVWVEKQLQMGAVALKLHPVHGNFPANARELYPAYALCEHLGIPVIVHAGTSTFPGSANSLADPSLLQDVLRDFPRLTLVLAHRGRGWWYRVAATMALESPNVWIEISGLPPHRLRQYYDGLPFEELAAKFIFGSDWPGVPSIRENVYAFLALGLAKNTVEAVLHRNAVQVYRLGLWQG